jgi:hypothetical protein
MFTGILYTHIFYALGGSEMPNGQNLRPIAVVCLTWRRRPAGQPSAKKRWASTVASLSGQPTHRGHAGSDGALPSPCRRIVEVQQPAAATAAAKMRSIIFVCALLFATPAAESGKEFWRGTRRREQHATLYLPKAAAAI